MAKNIVVLSDGTGNAASSIWRTNVWRTFQTLDLSGNHQVARYDNGVGSSTFIPLALLGGMFGYGLKRNVIDLYKFVCRNYSAGDRIYAFGFSRGAFTARVLVGLIDSQGLVSSSSEDDLRRLAVDAYRAYRRQGYATVSRIEVPLRWLRQQLIGSYRWLRGHRLYDADDNHRPNVAFIGVWDTVSAYGLPVDEMTLGLSRWIWPLELPNRLLGEKIDRACHALSIDDERTTFHPLLWTEDGDNLAAPHTSEVPAGRERITQVWFLGMHANVGGGYPDDGLAHIPLAWMLGQVKDELKFKAPPLAQFDEVKQLASVADKDGRMYDSRSGLGLLYRYCPRAIWNLSHVPSPDAREAVTIERPKIHCSVLERMASKSSGYAPLGLPACYDVIDAHGKVLPTHSPLYEKSERAAARVNLQEAAWNYVWVGRWFYFGMLGAVIYLLGFPWFHQRGGEQEYSSPIRMVSEFIRLTQAVLPSGARWWTDWYAANPIIFVIVLLLITLFVFLQKWAKGMAAAQMRCLWDPAYDISRQPLGGWHRLLFRVRTSPPYVAVIAFLKRKFFPFLFAVAFLWLMVGWSSHFLFNVADSMGAFCKEKQGPTHPLTYDNAVAKPMRFATNDFCARTGVSVEAKQRYTIAFEVVQPWKDGWIPVDPKGRDSWEAPSLLDQLMWRLGSPFRRVFFRGWFHPIARVGATGTAEYFLDPSGHDKKFTADFKTERSGELFLYVNDAALPLPWLYQLFYRRNEGEAMVTVTRACDSACKERTLKRRRNQCRTQCGTAAASPPGAGAADWARCYVRCVDQLAD